MSLEMAKQVKKRMKLKTKENCLEKKMKVSKSKRKLPLRSSLTEWSLRKSSVKSACITLECLDLDLSWLSVLSITHASLKKHLMLELPICSLLSKDKLNKMLKKRNSIENNKLLEKREKLMKTDLNTFLKKENGLQLKLSLTLRRRCNMSFA